MAVYTFSLKDKRFRIHLFTMIAKSLINTGLLEGEDTLTFRLHRVFTASSPRKKQGHGGGAGALLGDFY